MPSERIQRRIDRTLDEAEVAADRRDWATVADLTREVLLLDDGNEDAATLLRTAEGMLGVAASESTPVQDTSTPTAEPTTMFPNSFVAGRYHVRRFLGEGGKKKVFLAHDASLDRDVAFALIKTDGLDSTGRERIVREAQAMGRMGTHPHVVTIFEIGEEAGAPYVVTELMSGGDVEGLLEQAGGPLSLARSLRLAKDVADGLVFAHAQGIVHRDLKPGNVWLTADGVAKIGDFGLAVNTGRSRLTQHGLMVGTVAYMPPEQALGGQVTPQSDLYSFGVMLYELVTGKPPFQADDPTAVISQHINTPPVAPSWNTDQCPPDLEALILRLLAKVPADRPGSASEVLAALERVDPNGKSASHSDSTANPLDRVARGVFVGRDRELERLRGAFDQAFAGRGSVVMLVGEPGIGKTRTTQELETYARLRGAQVYWGRANEQGGAPPFWPWLLAGRAYRDQNAEEMRRKEWEPYAVELQRIFPNLRTLFPNLPEPPPVDSEEGQFQLFDAMSGFLRSVSERVPLVLVLDDLHWADRGTLQLLTHLARDLARSKLLVLGTYRDTDLDRRHPLSQALAEMNREDLFVRIALRGLPESDVRDYIMDAAGVEPSRELVRRVFEETEGNPFFLSEVVNLMAQEGTLSATSVSDVAIPEGVRQALGRRLDRLSDEANSLLTTLAVAGREFDHALVRALGGHDEQVSLRLIEEALKGRVLEEMRAGQYRFTHALMQETLLDELSAARRVLLHGQIAEAFDALYGADDRDHLSALANHYAESAVLNRDHARAAARCLRLAAEQSVAAFGWDEAVEHYERCLSVIDQARDPLGEDEAALRLDLAIAKFSTLGSDAWPSFDAADQLYARRPDAIERSKPWLRLESVNATSTNFRARMDRLNRVLADLGESDSAERCSLLAVRAYAMGSEGDADAAAAEAMAVRLGLANHRYMLDLSRRTQLVHLDRGEFAEAFAMGDALHASARAMARNATSPLNLKLFAALYLGDLDAAEEAINQTLAYAREGRRRNLELSMIATAFRIARRRGDADRCDFLADQFGPDAVVGFRFAQAEAAIDAGDYATALQFFPPEVAGVDLSDCGYWYGTRARIFVGLSDIPAARRELEAWQEAWRTSDGLNSVIGRTDAIGGLGEVADMLDEMMQKELLAYLDRYPDMHGFRHPETSCDHIRGCLALSLGLPLGVAERHFRKGFDWASRAKVHFSVDEGRCLQGLAEIAERQGNHALAMERLDAAAEAFARHGGAKLYLDQVLARKQILKA